MSLQNAYRLSTRVDANGLRLQYFSFRDEAWLRTLLDECARLAGATLGELRERLREPLAIPVPRTKLRVAVEVLERLLPEASKRAPAPRDVRTRAFRKAAGNAAPRAEIMNEVASELEVDAAAVELALFADLASQRRIGALPLDLSPRRLAILCNQALVQAFLKRAVAVRIRAWGNVHALVRQAQRLGLICVAGAESELAADPGTLLEISGPFALFRKTDLYGRALTSLLPQAARCEHFELEADCRLGRAAQLLTLQISATDPIFLPREPALADTRVESRFVREFGRVAPGWQIERAPEPIVHGRSLICPDWELWHPSAPDRRYRFELLGFWTPEHVRQKLLLLTKAKLERYVLCVDERRQCQSGELPDDRRVLRYKNRVKAAQVLERLED